MKKLILAAALLAPFAANAADLTPEAAAPAADAPFSWTGLYVGGSLGAIQSKVKALDPHFETVDISNWTSTATGVLVGGTVGYNYQVGSVVYGIEADLSYASAKDHFNPWDYQDGTYAADHKLEALGTVRGRVGYAVDRALFYATGGLAYGKVENDAWNDIGYGVFQDKWRFGWTAGLGTEFALTKNWTLGGEALYYDLGKDTANYEGSDISFKNTGLLARVKLNYKF